jgi:hypothetical protein
MSHCQRFKLKKTRGNSDLDHIFGRAPDTDHQSREESICYRIFFDGVSDVRARPPAEQHASFPELVFLADHPPDGVASTP